MSIWSNTITKVDALIDQRATTGDEFIKNFDGLRAVAALMVFTVHIGTIPHFALGPAGVWLFFALSGHLLYMGFLRSVKVPHSTAIVAYLVRRLFRILPLYFVCVLAMGYLLHEWSPDYRSDWIFEHLIFVRGSGHLWTTVTELVFYLYLPVVVLLLYPVRSERARLWILLALAFMAWYLFEHLALLEIRGGNPHFAPFLLGMATVHLRDHLPQRWAFPLIVFTLFWLALFSSDFAWGEPVRRWFGLYRLDHLWGFGFLLYPACAGLVLAVSRSSGRFWSNRWLRLIGVCGFGFYLWHAPIIIAVRDWGIPSPLFELFCFTSTTLLCITTYLLIEHPGIALGRRIASWVKESSKTSIFTRPAWICLAIITLFMIYRFEYIIGTRIEFRFEIAASQATVVKVYLDTGRGFSEWHAKTQKLAPHDWQTVSFGFRDERIKKVRIDPGEKDGIYRIRNLGVKYPFFGWSDMDLSALKPLARIEKISFAAGVLVVKATPGTNDPVLVYTGKLERPWWNTRTLMVVLAFFALLGTTIVMVLIDRLVTTLQVLGSRSGQVVTID